MDSAVQLALMAKAKNVFGADDTFLSFPVSLPTYSKRELDFTLQHHDAEVARQQLHNLKEFSTLVNLIPNGETWMPTKSRFLWEVYEKLLKEASFAFSTRTPDEEIEYQKALAYLRVANEEGIWEDSAPMKAYRQHKSAYLLSQQAYLAAKSTAECSSDSKEQEQWRDIDEPLMRAELDALQTQWILKGYKDEVMAAQSIVANLGARSPIQTWAEWNNRFNHEIDALTNAEDNFTFFPSSFSPSGALEDRAWRQFKLSEHEVKTLLKDVPMELRTRFAANIDTNSLTSLSFEFSSAAILRPWLASEIFRSRFWRFADESKIISNGDNPPKGDCPAYVAAVVFARKITIEQKQVDQQQPSTQQFSGFYFTQGVSEQERFMQIQREKLLVEPKRTELNMAKMVVNRIEVMPPKATILAMNHIDRAKLPNNAAYVAVAAAVPKQNTNQKILFSPDVTKQLKLEPPVKVTPNTSPLQSAKSTTPDDEIYILAFICKALPKCPDPDPTLQWQSG